MIIFMKKIASSQPFFPRNITFLEKNVNLQFSMNETYIYQKKGLNLMIFNTPTTSKGMMIFKSSKFSEMKEEVKFSAFSEIP